jgi:hypothetical protein
MAKDRSGKRISQDLHKIAARQNLVDAGKWVNFNHDGSDPQLAGSISFPVIWMPAPSTL